ncbi:MAG: hypothetical protein GJ679_04040 [Rhodobacteraceae bacterium]|jgi:Flp pilus assembly pilin Flp|uniref:Flp family type IVb pilin n=1 Tax=Roseovarius sp. 10 TaxID=3080563 RepID=UPI0019356619|nr:hypothetical protein [Roseovarius sp. 10]MBE1289160.1 hypothetical protein [Paracoccaceae bacterium]MDV7200994.1 hypothetical protein [Roseovarius sp. 10]QPI85160.1 hypothetical protein I3V23_11435 [Rhodobacterales bacterium HKCCA1288]
MNMIKSFFASESGAVTVDWVVLTGAMVGVGIAAAAAVSTGITGLTDDLAANLGAQVTNPND